MWRAACLQRCDAKDFPKTPKQLFGASAEMSDLEMIKVVKARFGVKD